MSAYDKQRFVATHRLGRYWHKADITRRPLFVRFWSEADIDRAALTKADL
jgi:hypothetical protein